jgi:hypothetical protein
MNNVQNPVILKEILAQDTRISPAPTYAEKFFLENFSSQRTCNLLRVSPLDDCWSSSQYVMGWPHCPEKGPMDQQRSSFLGVLKYQNIIYWGHSMERGACPKALQRQSFCHTNGIRPSSKDQILLKVPHIGITLLKTEKTAQRMARFTLWRKHIHDLQNKR